MLQSQYLQHDESFITIDPKLNALDGLIFQPEKLVEANETIKRIGLPEQ
jgi:hypothetical protein